MKATYSRHYRKHAEGHIFLGHDKPGAVTLHLEGAASMTQEELDFYGEVIAKALADIPLEAVKKFGTRKLREPKK